MGIAHSNKPPLEPMNSIMDAAEQCLTRCAFCGETLEKHDGIWCSPLAVGAERHSTAYCRGSNSLHEPASDLKRQLHEATETAVTRQVSEAKTGKRVMGYE